MSIPSIMLYLLIEAICDICDEWCWNAENLSDTLRKEEKINMVLNSINIKTSKIPVTTSAIIFQHTKDFKKRW